jgi:tRNA (guanine10-N2)-dimethyltransferase
MFKYLFELGHQAEISTAEIRAVFSQLDPKAKITNVPNNFVLVLTKKVINMSAIAKNLGGTVKILEFQFKLGDTNPIGEIISFIKNTQKQGKIVFSLSGKNSKAKALTIKKRLKEAGRSARYIEPKNSATILHNNLIDKQADLTLFNNELYTTCGLQDFVEFVNKDYGRPAIDSKSGMIPPKLARILINLSGADTNKNIYDPFCGSGTILMEAATMGFKKIYGSDVSEKAIRDTNSNLEWAKDRNHLVFLDYKLFNCDAREITKFIETSTIDLIITEPNLGNPLTGRETKKQLLVEAQDLSILYSDAFTEFYKVLKKGGVVIFIIPRFRFETGWVTVDPHDRIKKIGFKTANFSGLKSLFYHRPEQHLGREIWMFKK